MRQALRYVGLYGLAAIISVTGMLLAHACTPAMAEPVVSDLSIVAVGDSVRVGVWVQQPASADSVVALITGNGGTRRVPHKTGIGWQPLFAGTLAAPDSGLSAWYYAAVTAYRDGVPSATRPFSSVRSAMVTGRLKPLRRKVKTICWSAITSPFLPSSS